MITAHYIVIPSRADGEGPLSCAFDGADTVRAATSLCGVLRFAQDDLN